MVGGYAIERLIKASGDGLMEPVAAIGDIVEKGSLLAYTGGEPVYAQIDGVIRGMLQAGVPVKKGMKIGDVDPRKDESLVYLISDKSHKIGRGCVETIRTLLQRQFGIVVLAAGLSRRYGGNKLLEERISEEPLYEVTLDKLSRFSDCGLRGRHPLRRDRSCRKAARHGGREKRRAGAWHQPFPALRPAGLPGTQSLPAGRPFYGLRPALSARGDYGTDAGGRPGASAGYRLRLSRRTARQPGTLGHLLHERPALPDRRRRRDARLSKSTRKMCVWWNVGKRNSRMWISALNHKSQCG